VFGADLGGQLDGFQPEGFVIGAENKAANKVTEVKARSRRMLAGRPTTPAWRPKAALRRRRATSSRLARKSRMLSRSDQFILSSAH